MLRAIGIYEINDQLPTLSFYRITQAPKTNFYLFSTSEFDNVESSFLKKINHDNISQAGAIYAVNESEHHYMKRIFDIKPNPGKPRIMVICSKTIIDPKELAYLFININYVVDHPELTRHTLDLILTNPFNYIAKDHRLIEAQHSIHDLKSVLNMDVEKINTRGNLIEEISKQSVSLSTTALEFKGDAAKQNGYCSSCRVW